MPEWAGWVLAIAVVLLYFRGTGEDDARKAQNEVDRLFREEIQPLWTRCGQLEGYVDTMARRIVENDPFPDTYDAAVDAAKRWQEWRKEQQQLERRT